MTNAPVRIATRASALALAQSTWVAGRLRDILDRPVELVHVSTEGDRSAAPVAQIGVGVFVSAVRDALRDGRADLAVHSLKDLPTQETPDLVVAAIPQREDARDVLVSHDRTLLAGLPDGACIGTGSPRRIAFLRSIRPDLQVRPIRGNVDTRLRRVTPGDLDAVVLAAAGLHRLGRANAITQYLPVALMLPAPGQGALAVECRADLDDPHLARALAELDDADTRAAVTAERHLLAGLEAGCTAPLGAHAVVADGVLEISGAVVAHDGSRMLHLSETGPVEHPDALGQSLARSLLRAGAADLLGVTGA